MAEAEGKGVNYCGSVEDIDDTCPLVWDLEALQNLHVASSKMKIYIKNFEQ